MQAVLDIVQHCKKEVFPNKSLHLQAWALMEAAGHSLVNSSTKEELCILIQCRENSQLTFVRYIPFTNYMYSSNGYKRGYLFEVYIFCRCKTWACMS